MKIACTYKTGGDFDADYVVALYEAMKDYSIPFICFTDADDVPDYIDQIKLTKDWPGWWSKLEMIGHDDDLLCFDLDTVIVDDISDMIDVCTNISDNIIMLSDFYVPTRLASGIMYMPNQHGTVLYEMFAEQPSFYIAKHRGDQEFISVEFDGFIDRWNNILDSNYICSYKTHIAKIYPRHLIPLEVDPSKSKIICFHGKPRPKDVQYIK